MLDQSQLNTLSPLRAVGASLVSLDVDLAQRTCWVQTLVLSLIRFSPVSALRVYPLEPVGRDRRSGG